VHVPIVSRKEELSLGRIAQLWADETREPNVGEAAKPLVRAALRGKIKSADLEGDWWFESQEQLLREMIDSGRIDFGEGEKPIPAELARSIVEDWADYQRDSGNLVRAVHGGHELAFFRPGLLQYRLTMMVDMVLQMKVPRDEFLRWIDDEGYSRPTFWDGKEEGRAEPNQGNEPPSISIEAATTSQSGLEAWVQAQINEGNVPGKINAFTWKEAERQAKAAFPRLRGTSIRNLRRLFGRLAS
jgi:hypothetical protein